MLSLLIQPKVIQLSGGLCITISIILSNLLHSSQSNVVESRVARSRKNKKGKIFKSENRPKYIKETNKNFYIIWNFIKCCMFWRDFAKKGLKIVFSEIRKRPNNFISGKLFQKGQMATMVESCDYGQIECLLHEKDIFVTLNTYYWLLGKTK
jgi:hypothetical protein